MARTRTIVAPVGVTAAGTAALALLAFSCSTVAPTGPAPAAALDPVSLALELDPVHRHHALALEPVDGQPGTLIASLASPDRPFTEALPSWNAPFRSRFEVDIRVRSQGAPWSPWLRIGDWNISQRSTEATTTFAEGRVAVDVLELVAPKDTVELRLKSIDAEPLTAEAWMVLTDTSQLESATALPQPAPESAPESAPWAGPVRLEVAPRSQRSDGGDIGHRICSPTSVAMVASFHGRDVPTHEMAATLLDPHHDIYGNWNRAVQGAFSHGVRGRLARVSSWRTVAALLDQGLPLVASIRAGQGELRGAPYQETAGHLLVITGLDADGRIHVNDPAARTADSVARTYDRGDLERVWFANGGVTYLLEGAEGDRL